MVEVQLNKSNKNPFYGLKHCLLLFSNVNNSISESTLNACWEEVKDDKEKRQLFFSILFSVGDITARQHNIFKGVKKDNGGNANRESFYTIFNWLKAYHKDQFIVFLNKGLFNEYTCFDLLFRSRVKTKGAKVLAVYDIFADEWYAKELLNYVYAVINGNNPFNKLLIAKFLTLPRLSKRTGHKKMLPETVAIMKHKAAFLVELSKLMGWEYAVEGTYCNFEGYRKWRKDYNGNLESVLFTTGKINEFDETQFLDWFGKLPSQARFRVKNKILYSEKEISHPDGTTVKAFKWAKFQPWIAKWETYKAEKQAEQRVLEEKVRQNQASEEDLARLEKVKKEAKVTVGATNFEEIYKQVCMGTQHVDPLKIEAFMNRVNLPYNSLVIIDDSGSMRGLPFHFATFIAAVCLTKNPDDDGRNLLGFFNSYSHWHAFIDKKAMDSPNSILRTRVATTVREPFINPERSFMENYERIDAFCRSAFQGGGTNIDQIVEGLKHYCDTNPAIIDALMNYPIWTIISDGEWNNLRSPEASIGEFMRKCQNYFGFKPYVVAMDIEDPIYSARFRNNTERFSGIENFMYIPANPAQIEMFLTNFKDMEVMDIYAPLQSIFRSDRYELVREATL